MTTGWRQPSQPGDRHPSVRDAKKKLRAYSYGKALDDTDTYTVEFGVALLIFKQRRNEQILRGQVGNMPGMTLNGVLDWATKKNLQILPEQQAPPAKAHLPVVVSISGHMGGMFDGPHYFTARVLEEQGRVDVQPVGYDNTRKPFNNAHGVLVADGIVNDPNEIPPGTDWAVVAHSQGGIVFSDWWEQRIRDNRDHWPYSHFRGGVNYANPRRPRGVVVPWVLDPPPPGTEGLDPDCLDEPIPGVAEVARDGDMYVNKKPGTKAAEYTQAVYLIVARGRFTGQDSMAEELGELAMKFGNPLEIFAIFQALIIGVVGLINLREHGEFDLRPGIDHLARVLKV